MAQKFPLVFSSRLHDERPLGEQKSEDFTVEINSSKVDLTNWEIALDTASVLYSWFNISASQGNNIYDYTGTLGTFVVVMPDGQYTIEDMNAFLLTQLIANGDQLVGPGIVQLLADFVTGKVQIDISNPAYSVDLTTSTFHLLLGFTSKIVSVTEQGAFPANINNGVGSLLVHCSLARGPHLSIGTNDVVAQMEVNTTPHREIFLRVNNLIWMPIGNSRLIDVRIRITDDQNRGAPIIDLHNEPVSIRVYLRKSVPR